jgi:hypothetical protein
VSARIAMLVVLALVGVARAEPTPEAKATARQVLIALRVLSYDKTLAERHAGDTVTIAVVSSRSAEGRAERDRWAAGFALLPKVRVTGRPVRVITLDVDQLAQQTPAAIIVTSELDGELAAVVRFARTRQLLTFSRREPAVRAGIAVGLIEGKERDEIVINLESARASGTRFGAGLLQLARLVE